LLAQARFYRPYHRSRRVGGDLDSRQISPCAGDGLAGLVSVAGFVERNQLPFAMLAGGYPRHDGGAVKTDPRDFVVVGPVSRDMQNCDTVRESQPNVCSLLIGLIMDVAFCFFPFGKKFLLPLARTRIAVEIKLSSTSLSHVPASRLRQADHGWWAASSTDWAVAGHATGTLIRLSEGIH
jgi:hypothetical protein